MQGKGVALVAQAKEMLEAAIAMPGLGAETEIGQAILKCLEVLGKALPEGIATPGMQRAGMEQFMLQQHQTNPMNGIMAAQGQGGGQQPPPAPPQM